MTFPECLRAGSLTDTCAWPPELASLLYSMTIGTIAGNIMAAMPTVQTDVKTEIDSALGAPIADIMSS
jgi:hypothetical protein